MNIKENEIEKPSNNKNFEKKEKEMEELESIIGIAIYSLPVALIKIWKLNNYTLLKIEKYFDLVLPGFPMLKKTNEAKKASNNIKRIRFAIVSNKLFCQNEDDLYELNISKAIEYIKLIQKRKQIDKQIINGKKLNNKNTKFEKKERKIEIKTK